MELQKATIELPASMHHCVTSTIPNFTGPPGSAFPDVYLVHSADRFSKSHVKLFELPSKQMGWKDRNILTLLHKNAGLLFYWRKYSEDPRVYGTRTEYNLVWYYSDSQCYAESMLLPPGKPVTNKHMLFLDYYLLNGAEDIPF